MTAIGKIYFISEHSQQELVHGVVGLVDIETILLKNNAIPIRFPHHFDFSIKAKLARLSFLVRIGLSIKPHSVVVFQHPLFARMSLLLLKMLRFRPSVEIICIVTDIDGLKSGNYDLLEKEKKMFATFRYFILHNENMRAWLKSFHPLASSTLLNRFDFLSNSRNYKRTKSNTIVFAGNLRKSLFLEKLHPWLEQNPNLHINLYGPHVTEEMLISEKVSYKGLHHPHILPGILEGSFGLIWDGEEIAAPGGSLGDYMQFISHHKLSLYIVSNLPVIVHEETGSAEFVKRFNIGFTVKSLYEVEEKIKGISNDDYAAMTSNTNKLSGGITTGEGLQKALQELLDKIRRV